MLGWAKHLLGQTENPLADAKATRQWLATLPANDPIKVLTELAGAVQTIRGNTGLKLAERLEITLMLDDASIAHRNRLTREYLSQTRLSSYRENVLWLALHQYWSSVFEGYSDCLDSAQNDRGAHIDRERLLLFVLRGLHAGRQWLKWRFLRYAAIEGRQWRAVARFLVVAENNRISGERAALYGAAAATSASPQSEFMKLLLLGVSATGNLLPLQAEIASRLIDFVVGDCEWSQQQSPRLSFCFDLVGELPPMRVLGAPATPGVWRFFCGHGALPRLEQIREQAAAGVLFPGIQLGGEYPLRQVVLAAEHLMRYWSAAAPERRSERHASYRRMAVIYGFAQVLRHFAAPRTPEGPVEDAAAYDEHVELTAVGLAPLFAAEQGTESWVAENISQDGLGALIGRLSGDWLQVGQLLALSLQEPEEPWAVGVVRRLHQTAQGQMQVGIEILGRRVEAVRLNLCGINLQEDEFALLLESPAHDEFKLLTRVGTLGPASSAVLEHHGIRCNIRPRCWLEKGECFDLAIVIKQPLSDGRNAATETPC